MINRRDWKVPVFLRRDFRNSTFEFFYPPLKLRYENGTSPTRATCHNLIRINHPLKMHFNHETACDTCNKYTSIRVHVEQNRWREILTCL